MKSGPLVENLTLYKHFFFFSSLSHAPLPCSRPRRPTHAEGESRTPPPRTGRGRLADSADPARAEGESPPRARLRRPRVRRASTRLAPGRPRPRTVLLLPLCLAEERKKKRGISGRNLVKLGLKNAWLSVDGLKKMPNLTHLTLEFIRLDDENLDRLNESFPGLHTINLIGVGGLKDPKIHLPQLKSCRWEVSNVPRCLAIHAPNLVFLDLKCVRPERLILDTPSLSTLKLTIDKLSATAGVDALVSLKNLSIESLDLNSLIPVFVENRAITTLELELPDSARQYDLIEEVNNLDYLLRMLAGTSEVKLGPRFSCELIRCFGLCRDSQFRSCLQKFLIHVPPLVSAYELLTLFKICAPLCEVTVLFHIDSTDDIREVAAIIWATSFPEIRWQWGTWNSNLE